MFWPLLAANRLLLRTKANSGPLLRRSFGQLPGYHHQVIPFLKDSRGKVLPVFAPVSSPDPRYSLPEAVARLELEKQEYRRQRALAVQEEELRRNTFRPPPTGFLLPRETLNDDIPIYRDVQTPLEKDGPVAKAVEEEFPFL